MPKEKEHSMNPAQQQHKLKKDNAVKKGKAKRLAQRTEKLARRNPNRLQRQIDDLKALEQSGSIKPREKQILEDLEKDLRAVKKAREALAERSPQYGNASGPPKREGDDDKSKNGVLGKRKWGGDGDPHRCKSREQDSGSETDESVRRIPMPKDTPPPLPHRRNDVQGTNANAEPLPADHGGEIKPKEAFSSPVVKTTYERAPEIRDLRKEAVKKFVPSVVKMKQDIVKGTGRLMEPEEFDTLQREGYRGRKDQRSAVVLAKQAPSLASSGSVGATRSTDSDAEARCLAEEEERFRKEIRQVEIEDVEDQDL